MRRLLGTVVLASVLVFSFSTTLPGLGVVAQRKSNRPAKTTPASLATQRGADTITAAQLKDYLSFIASDEMEGRDTPSRGLDITAKFLATNLSRWGFKPAGGDGTFFQKITMRKELIDLAATRVQLNGEPLVFGDDYIPMAANGDVTAPLVFAGSGWFFKSKNIDPYKTVDPEGKIVVIFSPLNALPWGFTRADLAGKQGEDWMNPVAYAISKGAVGIVVVPDFQYLANWDRNRNRLTERPISTVEKFQTVTAPQLPRIILAPRLTNSLFMGEKHTAASLFEQGYGGQMPESFALHPDKKLTITIKVKSEAALTQNVVAVFEGSDPILKNEYVALGAHYDHVGTGPAVNGDSVYNGADDDGSGTTALLGIAEALGRAAARPKRSALFVWHAGEEKGLWGSRYFTAYPTVPLENIVAQINIDMIGRSKKEGDTNLRNKDLSGPNEIYVIGSRMMSTELGVLTETVNKQYLNLTYDYRYDDPADPNRFFFRSDHVNYARKGIPIVFFFDGEHEDYHGRGDSADKIDYQKMEKITRTVYMTLWELANRPVRPKVDKPLPAQLSGN
ncbi:MAG: M28 family peptidase [Pyrinomonadaceae bacterium]|nr:M28 family peptidase [Pyrinomonadaceae bacterium]